MTPDLTQMIDICSEVFQAKQLDFNITAIRSKSRVSELVRYRRIAAIALRNKNYSLNQIGMFINRNHATVMHLLYTGGWYPVGDAPTRDAYRLITVQKRIAWHREQIKILEEQL